MNASQEPNLRDRLELMLRRQIESARRSDFQSLERLMQKTGQIVQELANRESDAHLNEEERRRLTALYRELVLILSGAKDVTDRQLRQLRGVRKTLDVYSFQS